jgi:phosphate acyltransferase
MAERKVTVALDTMGGDHGPEPMVEGAIEAAGATGARVILVGPQSQLSHLLDQQKDRPKTVSIVPAEEWIASDEEPVEAIRKKKASSINVGLGLLKSGQADAFVSAGSTGAVMAGSFLTLGRIRGYARPAIAAFFPHRHGGVLIIDVGANAECKPQHLLQFGQMGSAYLEHVLGRKEPRVGLLNIGEEATKGSDELQEAFRLLTRAPLNFIGNVEGKDLPTGRVDVVVTDGFTGNVVLKAAEGVAGYVVSELRKLLTSRLDYKVAALVLQRALRGMASALDYNTYGGAPLLGVNGVVIICHGRSTSLAIRHAIRVAADAANSDLIGKLREAARTKTSTTQRLGYLPPPGSS